MEISGKRYGGPGYDTRTIHRSKQAPAMISRGTIYLCRLRHTAVAVAPPAMISRGTIYLCRLRHTAVAEAAPAMISRARRRSTVVVIVIVRNRSYDATVAATVQHCRRSSSQPHAPSLALSGTRGTMAVTVQRRRRSQPHAPPLALSGTRGTTAATVQRRRSSQPHGPSLALSGTRGITATTVQRRRSSQPHGPSLALAGTRGTLATVDRRWMLDLRIALRRGKRSGLLRWTAMVGLFLRCLGPRRQPRR